MTTLGPSLVTSGTSQGTGVSWVNASRITAADSSGATTSGSIKNGSPSALLTGTGLGFSVPAGSTINGITLTVSAKDTSNLARIFQGFLTKDGVNSVGTNQASTTALTTAFATYTIGGPTNLWGTTWAYTDINSANFGGMIQFDTSNTFVTTSGVQVDWMKIQVDYSSGGTNYAITATISGASSISGSAGVAYALAGSLSNASSVSGSLTQNFAIASTISAVSSIVAALGNNQAIAATISAASNLAGTLLRNFGLSGLISAITDLAASMVVNYGGAATVSNTSNISADMGIDRGLVGTITNQTNVTGTLSVQKAPGSTTAPGMLGDSNVCDLSP